LETVPKQALQAEFYRFFELSFTFNNPFFSIHKGLDIAEFIVQMK
jgi:hypothetical protein